MFNLFVYHPHYWHHKRMYNVRYISTNAYVVVLVVMDFEVPWDRTVTSNTAEIKWRDGCYKVTQVQGSFPPRATRDIHMNRIRVMFTLLSNSCELFIFFYWWRSFKIDTNPMWNLSFPQIYEWHSIVCMSLISKSIKRWFGDNYD